MKFLNVLSGILFNITAVAFGTAILFSSLCANAQVEDMLSEYVFGKGYTETINTGKAPIRYKTWYTCVQDVINGNGDVAKAAQAEGTVLLKNENNALPLDPSKDKVSLFGVTAYDPMYSLDGAGEVKINKDRQQFFKDEIEKVGLDVNEDLASWYNEHQEYWRTDYINIYDNTTNANGKNAKLNGANWSVLPTSKEADGYNTGIFVTGRMTNEAIDLNPNNVKGLGAKDDDYLKFTDNELSVLQGMKDAKAAGKLDKIIVLFNQANPMQEDLPEMLKEYDVDAALWIGFPGSDGISAVADILVGKTCPSGGLSTTWYANRNANPSTAYFANNNNVIMQEGIYLGYRYAETRYEDYVLGIGNTENYDYGSNISYPFGYGESYADFTYEIVDLKIDENPSKNYDTKGNKKPESELREIGDDYILTVKVTNNSETFSAKENVQIYVQKPYTEENRQHKVEKSSVELVGYGKTKKLAPHESDEIQISIDANKTFASYDITDNTYVLDSGDYYLTAARNSHQAINNILMQKAMDGFNVDTSKMDIEYGAGDASLVKKINVDKERSDTYEYWTLGGEEVTNLFDHADPNKASGDENMITFMSRQNWTKTADEAKSQTVTITGEMGFNGEMNGGGNFSIDNVKKYLPQAVDDFENVYPNYGLHRNGNVAEVQLSEMIGVEYEDSQGATEEDKAKWEYFMDQLTWEETCTLVGNGLRRTVAIDSIGKPYTNDVNASNAISWKFDMSIDGGGGTNNVGFAYHFDAGDRNHNPTGYPCGGIIAATFNNELSYAVGQAIGEDGLWTGSSGLYGFGLGLHRNPYHGRAGEYYSDDPFLAGTIGGWESKGSQDKGMYVYNKHFVLNDQETSRTSYNTWLTEQTFREVYLRSFELAIEIGDAMNVMNAFNHIGTTWSGNDYNLMTAWLRGEAGMRGFAVTDYWKSGGMNLTYGMLAGTDLPDGNGAQNDILKYGPNGEAGGNYGFYAQAVRQAAQRILYTVANSNAMNFIGVDTQIIVHDPAWFSVRDRIITCVYALFGVSTAFYVGTFSFYKIKDIIGRKKSKTN